MYRLPKVAGRVFHTEVSKKITNFLQVSKTCENPFPVVRMSKITPFLHLPLYSLTLPIKSSHHHVDHSRNQLVFLSLKEALPKLCRFKVVYLEFNFKKTWGVHNFYISTYYLRRLCTAVLDQEGVLREI